MIRPFCKQCGSRNFLSYEDRIDTNTIIYETMKCKECGTAQLRIKGVKMKKITNKKRYEQAIKEHKSCNCGDAYHKKAIEFYKNLVKEKK